MNYSFEEFNKKAEKNFLKEYINIKHVTLNPSQKKRYLGGVLNKICRYCNKNEKSTTFKKVAHAIPFLIGNRTLIDNLECDKCNEHFGKKIEDSFANYFHPYRLMNSIRGRKRLKYNSSGLDITTDQDRGLNVSVSPNDEQEEPAFVRVSEDLIKFTLERPAYYPVAIYKTFVKIALALMPESEKVKTIILNEWLLSNEQVPLIKEQKVIQWKVRGPSDPDTIRCTLYKAKPEFEDTNIRYVLIFAFSSFQFQVPIPSINNENPNIAMPLAPSLRPIEEYKEFGNPSIDVIDFSSNAIVRNEKVEIFFRIEESQIKDASSSL
ncbi:HNH endonuclease [Pseudomonas petroselini]|uniref:HNH endonuclease n=1 Tax=Pseudomonas petroselini TaxID=2899822 RepID=UPI00386EF825